MSDQPACPACGKAVDPLRAGEVAIVGGGFLYFCDRACKADYFGKLASTSVSPDVETVEPPPVSVRRVEKARAPAHAEAHETAEKTPPPPEDSYDRTLEAPPEVDPPPPSLVDASVEPPPAPAPEPSPFPRLMSIACVAAGLLALGLPLVGASTLGVRGTVAIGAASLAVLREVAGRRAEARVRYAPAETWTGAAAIGIGVVAAVWAHLQALPQEGAIAAFLGLAAVSSVLVREALERSGEPVTSARARIAAALEGRAELVDAGGSREVRCEEVRPGEQIVVRAGETVTVDGVVTAGDATVAPWLDAQTEVAKKERDPIVAGARVVQGSLRIMATWSGIDRAFCKLALSPTSRVDVAAPLPRLSRLLTTRAAPLVAILAGAAAFANNAPVPVAVAVAAAALFSFATQSVVSAVAIAHARAHLRAQRSGIVYKDAAAFDRAGDVDVAVACARGTLLLGEPEIVVIEPLAGATSAQVLAKAAGLSSGSTHPFALAILRAARARGVKQEGLRNTVHEGSGATALDATGERIVLGRRAFLLAERVGVAAADARVGELEAQGRSTLLIASGGRIVGLLAFQDGLRVGARAAIQRLLDARIEPVMLSGESRETCETIARALDIEHIRPEVTLADRGAEVKALAEGGNVVAVMGHPTADDGALGAADVSVALSSAGESPGEWTVSLASDDVRDAVFALTIPRAARDRARRALVAGFAPGVAACLALALGIGHLSLASLASLVGSAAALYAIRE